MRILKTTDIQGENDMRISVRFIRSFAAQRPLFILLLIFATLIVLLGQGPVTPSPEAMRIAEVLRLLGNADTADRFISDIKGGRVVFRNLGAGIFGETGRNGGTYQIAFNSHLFQQVNIRQPVYSVNNINWAVTIEHEYVHGRQITGGAHPDEVPLYEDPAWRKNVELIQAWMREQNHRLGKLRSAPDSPAKAKELKEIANWIKSLRSAHSDALAGVREKIREGKVSRDITLPVIDMTDSRDISYVEKKLKEKAGLWEKAALADAEEVENRLKSPGGGVGNLPSLSAKQEDDLLSCVCKKGCAASARYHPDPLEASPSCKNVSNGPCICQGFGCTRSRISREETEACMKKLKINSDKAATAAWVYERNLGKRPAETTKADPPPKTSNLARNKLSSQSSRSPWSTSNDAQGAVDGIKNGKFGFHTDKQPNPWWQVDLGKQGTLKKVVVYNRLDYNPERSRTIRLLLSSDGTHWNKEYQHNGKVFGGVDGHPLKITLADKKARFVRLQLNENTYFHLDEVEIEGVE